ncbi:MAG: peptidase C11 [Lachnospiraceae bacterium]|nr:peptidase C11 [Lachnospiraceae bacterium]
MEPNGGREKHVTSGGKGVHKRGEGLGTGPVGKSDGYAGRTEASSGNRASGGGSGMNPKTAIILFILLAVLGGGGGGAALFGSDGADDYAEPTGNQSETTPQEQQAGASSLLGMLTGFTGNNNVTTGWDTAKNTGQLNRSVAAGSREKRTQILGAGKDTVTIMIYMCGTDLESRGGMASNDIAEMCAANITDKVNILIYTGGCKAWKTSGISNDVNQIYRVHQGKLERVVENDGTKVMTMPENLTSFIKWCNENYPANRNDLIFWDHGGGSISGYGYDEKFATAGSMNLSKINKALKDSGVTFDFIGFDACLMATLETALVTSNYADYLIASEETEPGIGWYYTDWLNSLCTNTSQDTLDTAKNIIDGFVTKCDEKCRGQKTTLSVIDLAEISYTVPEKLSAFSGSTMNLIKGDDYKLVSDARAGTREFAVSSKIDQIDLVNFANHIGTDEAKELSKALLGAVKYNRTSSNMSNAYGVSIYFPYRKASKVDTLVSTYNEIGMDDEYAKCIKSFAGMETGGQIGAGGQSSPISSLLGMSGGSNTVTGSDALGALLSAYMNSKKSIDGIDRANTAYMDDEDCFDAESASEYIAANQFDSSELIWEKDDEGKHIMALADDKWALIQSLQLNMFYDDGGGYIDLGLDNVYKFTSDGRLIGETDNTWLSIDGQPVAYYYEGTVRDGDKYTITGRVPALLNGERVNLIIVFDNENPYGYIAGARYDYVESETDTVAKATTELNEGDTIDFLCDYYTYDGIYKDSYMLGEQLIYEEGLEISNTDVGGDTQITYLLTDIYGQEYWTPVVPN